MNVMSIDDSATIRKIIKISLGDLNATIIEAENGKQALEKLRENPKIDLFIVDINMPEMNGIEFINTLKHEIKYARYLHTPVIVLTTEKEQELKKQAFDMGADAWTVKPFDPKEFKKLITDLIGEKSMN